MFSDFLSFRSRSSAYSGIIRIKKQGIEIYDRQDSDQVWHSDELMCRGADRTWKGSSANLKINVIFGWYSNIHRCTVITDWHSTIHGEQKVTPSEKALYWVVHCTILYPLFYYRFFRTSIFSCLRLFSIIEFHLRSKILKS